MRGILDDFNRIAVLNLLLKPLKGFRRSQDLVFGYGYAQGDSKET